jgi:hypothetical protein
MCTIINKDDFLKHDIQREELTMANSVPDTRIESTEAITIPDSTIERIRYEDLLFSSPTFTPPTRPVTEEASSTHISPLHAIGEETTTWPKAKYPSRENAGEEEGNERKTNVEAQRQNLKVNKAKGGAIRNMCFVQSLLSASILACLM